MKKLSTLQDEELEQAIQQAKSAYWTAWMQEASVDQLRELLEALEYPVNMGHERYDDAQRAAEQWQEAMKGG